MSKERSWSIHSPRKLTDEESEALQSRLRSLFETGDEEDINDIVGYTLAMVSNHKEVHYIVKELNSMGLEEVCPPELVQTIGASVCEYLQGLFPSVSSETAEQQATAAKTNTASENKKVVSIKSSSGGNALTMSGALGATREGRKKDNSNRKQKPARGNQQRDRNDKNSKNNRRNNDTGGDNSNRRDTRGGDAGGGGSNRGGDARRRDDRGRAFDRLTGRGGRGNQRDGGHRRDRNHRRGGEERRDSRGGDGRWQGRGENRRAAPPNNNNRNVSGHRRDRVDEQDFIPSQASHGRGGERNGGRAFRGDPSSVKRARYDGEFEQRYEHHQGRDQQGFVGSWRGGGRGGYDRGGRGQRGGRYSGRFVSDHQAFNGNDPAGQGHEQGYSQSDNGHQDVPEGAAGHPSPIVAAEFGRGRGYRGRGRGRGRGLGRGYYRADVQSMLAAKTWVRKKDDDNNNQEKTEEAGEAS